MSFTLKDDISEQKYDLAVHFKGFYNIFQNRSTTFDRPKHIQEVSSTFANLINKQNATRILIVWDGDDMTVDRWTYFMTNTVKLLESNNKIITLDFLTCKQIKIKEGDEKDYGVNKREDYLAEIIGLDGFKLKKNHDLYMYTYGITEGERANPLTNLSYFKSQPTGFETVGMYLLYLSSQIANKVIVLCVGGGPTVLNEFNYSMNVGKSTVIDNDLNKIENPINKIQWYVYENDELMVTYDSKTKTIDKKSVFIGPDRPKGILSISYDILDKYDEYGFGSDELDNTKQNNTVYGFGNNNKLHTVSSGGSHKTKNNKKRHSLKKKSKSKKSKSKKSKSKKTKSKKTKSKKTLSKKGN